MDGTFDASAGATGGPRHEELSLLGMAVRDSEQRMSDSLQRIDEMLAEMDEREDDDDFDEDIEALLERVTGADDAPLEFRSLNSRVRAGRLTWREFWRDPTVEPCGMELLQAVMVAQAADITTRMEQMRAGQAEFHERVRQARESGPGRAGEAGGRGGGLRH